MIEIPDPQTVAARKRSLDTRAAKALLVRVVAALNCTTTASIKVDIRKDERLAVEKVSAELRAKGYKVDRYQGDQREPCDELHVRVA